MLLTLITDENIYVANAGVICLNLKLVIKMRHQI